MKSKTMILMGIAIVCGLAASYMTSRLLAEREQQVEAPPEEKVTILVATQNLPHGQYLTDPEKCFQEKVFTKGQQPSKALTSYDELRNKYLMRPLRNESHVTKEDLTDKEGFGLIGRVPPGMRAMAIRVNAETQVNGFIMPNTRVDVMCTVRGEESKIILQDMLVLAVDGNDAKAEGQRAMMGNTVTLLADPDQSELLAFAQSAGELRLVLRGIGDKAEIKTGGKGRPELFSKKQEAIGAPKDGDEENGEGGSGSGPAGVGPKSPKRAVAKNNHDQAEDDTTTHVMIVLNGAEPSKYEFKFDKDGKCIESSEAGSRPTTKAVEPPSAKTDPPPAPKADKSESKTDKSDKTNPDAATNDTKSSKLRRLSN